MFVCFYYSVSILFLFIAMRLNAYKLICLYYNSKHPCKLSCLCLVKPLSFRLLSLLCLFCLCSALLFVFVCYAIKCAPCSGNAGRQKQHHGQSIAERRQGNARRACHALPDCLCYRCIIYHYARTYAAGVYRPAPGVLFRYGLREKISQIGLAHPPNPLFAKQFIHSRDSIAW